MDLNTSRANCDSKHADATETQEQRCTFLLGSVILRGHTTEQGFTRKMNSVCISWGSFALEKRQYTKTKDLKLYILRIYVCNFPIWQTKMWHLRKVLSKPSSLYLMPDIYDSGREIINPREEKHDSPASLVRNRSVFYLKLTLNSTFKNGAVLLSR